MNKELLEALAHAKAVMDFTPEEEPKPKPCKIKDCHCTHLNCDRGWIEHTVEGIVYVDACFQCRPVLKWGLKEYEGEELQDRLRSRAIKLAEKAADQRTLL